MDTPRLYEFTPDQNDLITRMAGKMRGVGFVHIMIGMTGVILAGLVALVGLIDTRLAGVHRPGLWAVVGAIAVVGVINFFVGAWTFKAGKAFLRITATRGNDIGLLMDALREQHKVYSLTFTLIAVGSALVVAAIAVAVVGTLAAG